MAKKLYGTDPDQVPTNADLGTMAYQDSGNVKLEKDSGAALTVERKSSDGNLSVFKQDGTTVGNIGSYGGGANLFINSSTSALSLRVAGGDQLTLTNGNLYPTSDSGVNLGLSNRHFNNLHLSGGIFFNDAGSSGTSTSNELDSYEEGTWTPVVQGSSTAGSYTITTSGTARYVKVGNLATVFASINNITQVTAGSGYLQIAGLPFTKPAATYASGSVGVSNGNLGFTPASLQVEFISTSGTSNVVYVYAHRDNATSVNFQIDDIVSGTTDIRFSITYKTA